MERKTLTEWPTELPEGRWEYVIKHMGDYDWTGHFAKDNGEIVFHDIDGGVWGPDSFTRGESFRPVDDDYVAPVRDVAAEAVLDAGPDPRDARITDLEAENAALKGRLRETCQILVESVGGFGPCNAEDAARRAIEVVDQLRAQLAAPCEPSPWKRLGFVHDGIRVTSVAAARDEDGMGVVALWDLGRDGVWRLCGWGCTEDHEGPDDGEEPLPETPPACLLTIPGKTPEPAPLRLGRGPTHEEFRRHNATGGGWLLQGAGEDMGGWTMEMRPIPEADIPAMVRFTRDAIPLNASRQPCGVGVKS